MSREIFLVNDYDGGFKERFEFNIAATAATYAPYLH